MTAGHSDEDVFGDRSEKEVDTRMESFGDSIMPDVILGGGERGSVAEDVND